MANYIEKLFSETGIDLFQSGAITTHGGNLSMYDGEHIWITRTGARLGRLVPGEVQKTNFEPSHNDQNCSSELIVHRAMYHAWEETYKGKLGFEKAAIVHAHTSYTVLESLYADEIVPIESECKYIIGKNVPVISPDHTIGSQESADMMAEMVAKGHNIIVVRNHGPFAITSSMNTALQLISSLEHNCRLANLVEQKNASRKILGID